MMGSPEQSMAVNALSDVSEYIPPTLREQMTKKKQLLLAEVERIDEALRMLDSVPQYEQVHDAIVKAQGGRLR